MADMAFVTVSRKAGDTCYRDGTGKPALLSMARNCPWHAGGRDKCCWQEEIECFDHDKFWRPWRVVTGRLRNG